LQGAGIGFSPGTDPGKRRAEVFLELNGIRKRYGIEGEPGSVEVLRGVDLSLKAGESVAVAGPSGCGKSTLLNIMGGLDRPTSGSVVLAGKDLSALGEADLARVRNLEIGFVFQLHHLLPQCSVLENVVVPAAAGHVKEAPEKIRERALGLLERVGLADRLGHTPARLSGGELQRAAVVRALVLGPGLVLADEPTGSLDGKAAAELGDLLVELNRESGVTLVIVTHSLELAARCGRVFHLAEGRLSEEGERGA
jgi:predicted ABC-type transport system involved in lysophospholipase L1 biosynthesis ATPase subunit